VNDYWTADVFALYGLLPIDEGRQVPPGDSEDASTIIKLLEPSVGGADGRSRTSAYGNVTVAASIVTGSTKAGYIYRVFDFHADDSLARDTDGTGFYGAVHHPSRYAVMAFPESPSAGKQLYIVDQSNTIWVKDLVKGYEVGYVPMGAGESTSRIRGTGHAGLDDAWRFPARPEAAGARRMP
jgi:hypothetical protein